MTDTITATRPPGPHPTPEQLYRARRGPRTSEAERQLAHAAACALCTEELLRQEAFDAPQPVPPGHLSAAWESFGKAPQAPLAPVISINRPTSRIAAIVQPPPRRPAAWSRHGGILALAAALVTAVIAVAGFGRWSQPQAPPPAPRVANIADNADGADVLRGAGEPAGTSQPSGTLDAPPVEILFPASPDGEPRRVTVFDATRSYTWTSPPASGGRVAFPEAERAKLRSGVDYFWTVIEEENAAARSFRLR